MSIEDNLGSFLSGQPTIVAAVAQLLPLNNPAIAPIVGAEGMPFPRVLYNKEEDGPVYFSGGVAALRSARFRIECQAKTIPLAETLRDAVSAVLLTFTQPTGVGTNTVNRLFIDDDSDMEYPSIHGEETGVFAKALEISLDYI